MLNLHGTSILLAVGIALFSLRTGMTAESVPAPTIVEPTLTLVVQANKTTYVQFEPVYLTCTLKNASWQAIAADISTLGLDGDRLTVYVQDAAGSRSQYYSGPIVDRLGTAIRDFAPAGMPGDRMVGFVSIFFNDVTGRLAFPVSGRYDIETKVFLGSLPEAKYAVGETLQIEVVEPSGVDRQLIESVGGEDRLIQLLKRSAVKYCDEKAQESCYAKLRGLVSRYSDSNYSPAIAFGLARAVGAGVVRGAPRPDLEAEILKEFLSQWSQHPLAPEVMRFLILALHKGGRDREASELVRRFEADYPGRESPRRWIKAAAEAD